MERSSDETVSVWRDAALDLPASTPPRDAAVCVIGAGIAGLTTAYLLRRDGADVQVVDAYAPGAGETGRTTGHLTAVLDDRFARLEKLFGTERARLAVASHLAAIDRIEALVREEGIDCDFERTDGFLVASDASQRELARLALRRRRARAERARARAARGRGRKPGRARCARDALKRAPTTAGARPGTSAARP